jgi:hypothetical protein
MSGGRHNENLTQSRDRLIRGSTYRDLGTICVIPTRGLIPTRVVQSWWGLITPMNQKFVRFFVEGDEVGAAYNTGVEQILATPELRDWPFLLTLEEDNIPPPDGLMKLYEAINGKVDGQRYDVVGGLYWTKGEGGQPMIYGDPKVMPKNFVPQLPLIDAVQPANGLGMGFNLFRLELFKRLERPWFKTVQEYIPGQGTRMYTQDLYFYEKAAKIGCRFACDTRVKVGHYDYANNIIW